MKISELMEELIQIVAVFGDIEVVGDSTAVVKTEDGGHEVRLMLDRPERPLSTGLNTVAMNQALADHEREMHHVTDVVDIPDDCLADTKRRYDAIVSLS